MAPEPDNRALAEELHGALESEDWKALRGLLADDAEWILPGDNTISAAAPDADSVVERARLIASYGMNFDLREIVVSRHGAALLQHNTAVLDGRHFDERVATVCRMQGGRIASIETFVSDLEAFDRYFV